MATTDPPPPGLHQIKNPVIRAIAAQKLADADADLASYNKMFHDEHAHADAMFQQFIDRGTNKFILTRMIGQYRYGREKYEIPLRLVTRKHGYEHLVKMIILTATQLDNMPLMHLPTEENGPPEFEEVFSRIVKEHRHKVWW